MALLVVASACSDASSTVDDSAPEDRKHFETERPGAPVASDGGVVGRRSGDAGLDANGSPGDYIKWNPGHYMQLDFNASTLATQGTRFGYYDAIADSTTIAGAAIGLKWSQLETAQGDYAAGIALIQADIDKLKGLSVPKRLVIRMMPQTYAAPGVGCDFYPKYIRDMGGCGTITQGTHAAIWNTAIADRYIALMGALAAAFDGEPYFEAIWPLRETSIAPVSGNFTFDQLDTQLRRVVKATVDAFEHTNVTVPVNYLDNPTRTTDFIAYLGTIRSGVSDPDTCSDCDIWGNRTVRGLSGGVDHRGRMPLIWSVEASELGLDSVGPSGGYTAQQIFDFANGVIRASHLLWERQNYTGTPDQQWDVGMLNVINAQPMTNTACPENYGDRCVTQKQ